MVTIPILVAIPSTIPVAIPVSVLIVVVFTIPIPVTVPVSAHRKRGTLFFHILFRLHIYVHDFFFWVVEFGLFRSAFKKEWSESKKKQRKRTFSAFKSGFENYWVGVA